MRDAGSERHTRGQQEEKGAQEIYFVWQEDLSLMKKLFVSDLTSEQLVTAFFLVHAKEIRNTKEGKQYLRMELADRSGTIEPRMSTKFAVMVQDVARDDFVKVEGRVELYRDKPQL